MFAGDSSRAQLQRELTRDFASYDGFLKQLQMKIAFNKIEDSRLERAAQLINKTNQFNLTHVKTSPDELKSLLSNDHFGFSARLEDKFGSMGLIAVIVAQKTGTAAHIKHWVMSCRVIGRKVEDESFFEFVNECRQAGVIEVRGIFKKTGKTQLVKYLYPKVGITL